MGGLRLGKDEAEDGEPPIIEAAQLQRPFQLGQDLLFAVADLLAAPPCLAWNRRV